MIELLAPAGDLLRLRVAAKYGADAVYIGGKHFSLRARASNFSLEDIREGTKFLHALGKKIYVTLNIVFQDEKVSEIINYIKFLNEVKVDAVIITNLFLISYLKKYGPNLEIHLSTQSSVMNVNAINIYKSLGVDRVVLAREVSFSEIKKIVKASLVDLEFFIHGGMCSSISGRCVLSNYLAHRDANRGGCAHSCRWNYFLKYNNKKLFIGSKDLNLLKYIKKIKTLKTKVSLKIEGRMKSEFYLAYVLSSYRSVLDEKANDKRIINELKRLENRKASHGFFNGKITRNEMLFQSFDAANKIFVGKIIKTENNKACVEVRNYFKSGDKIKVLLPNNKTFTFTFVSGIGEDGKEIFICNKPKTYIYIDLGKKINEGYLYLEN